MEHLQVPVIHVWPLHTLACTAWHVLVSITRPLTEEFR